LQVSEEKLAKANKKRVGETYEDVGSATVKGGSAKTAPLTESPFIREFEYGACSWRTASRLYQLYHHSQTAETMEYLLIKIAIILWRGGRGSLREYYKSYKSKRLTLDTPSKDFKCEF
jgi:hypothetical protein